MLLALFISFLVFLSLVGAGAVLLLIASSDGRLDVHASVDLPVSPVRAFAWLESFEQLSEWRHTFVGATGNLPEPFSRGMRRGFVLLVRGEPVRFEATVRDVVPARHVDFRCISTVVDLDVSHRLEPLADGRMTRVTVFQRARFKGPLRLFAASQVEAAQAELQTELAELQLLVSRYS